MSTVNVGNAPHGARIDAWIDWNSDGVWGPGEKVADAVPVNEGVNDVPISVPVGGAGRKIARFRLSSAGALSDTGPASDGEVEDYEVTIAADTEPGVVASTDDITAASAMPHRITVTVSDPVAVDVSSIETGDIAVLLPSGARVIPALLSVDSATDVPLVNGVFEFAAPGGTWDTSDNGIYEIMAEANAISNVFGIDALAGSIGSFEVAITPPGVFEYRGTFLGTGLVNQDVDLGDLDGDGDLDAFITTTNGPNQVWLNNGAGEFVDSTQLLGDDGGRYSALGDLDGDGDLDAVAATNGEVVYWRNDGSALFSLAARVLVSNARDVAIADFNADGYNDVFVAQSTADIVLLNDGFGNLFHSGQFLGNVDSGGVETGDVDGDGDVDAVVAVLSSPTSDRGNKVWINDGTGNFTDSGQSLGDARTNHVALGDLDGDGDLDAWSANSSTGGAPQNRVFINNGNGVFADIGQALGEFSTSHVALADLDLDGDLDAYAANFNPTQLDRVWLNDGSALFFDAAESLGSDTSSHVALGDIDADGDVDAIIATANASEPNRVWFNTTDPPSLSGDFDANHQLDGDDLDLLCLAIQAGDQAASFDLDANGVVNAADLSFLLNLQGALMGDANLDGTVDGQDFIVWNAHKFEMNDPAASGIGWATADFNCDGSTDGSDFIVWSTNKFTSVELRFIDLGDDPWGKWVIESSPDDIDPRIPAKAMRRCLFYVETDTALTRTVRRNRTPLTEDEHASCETSCGQTNEDDTSLV